MAELLDVGVECFGGDAACSAEVDGFDGVAVEEFVELGAADS